MARIRSIKPEFFMHDGLAELSPLHRLLFIGLWTIADRDGRLLDRPIRIKSTVLPYDRADVDRMLTELAEHRERFIVRYQQRGEAYIQVSHFTEHQHPHVRELESKFPPPRADTGSAQDEPGANTGLAPVEPVGLLSLVSGQGNGLGNGKVSRRGRATTPQPSRRSPPDFELTDDLRTFAMERGLSGHDLDEELGAFRDKEFPKPHSDWPGVWRTWVRNWVKWGGTRHEQRPTKSQPVVGQSDPYAAAEAREAEQRARVAAAGRPDKMP